MADKQVNPLGTEQYTGLVRAALHPDERKFFKEYLGQDSPDVSDYLLPQGRFSSARQVREDIVRQTLQHMIPSATNPQATLGEARGISPNFPAPPNAQSYGEAEGPGVPQATGIIPGQGMSKEMLSTPTAHGTMQDSVNKQYAERGSPYFSEGLRPSTPMPTEDMSAVLPRSYQNLLVQKTHQFGLRPVQATAATRKADMEARYKDIVTGADTEDYPGEAADMRVKLGLEQKGVLPDSAKGRILESTAQIKESEAKFASRKNQANLDKTVAQTEGTQADTQTENLLRQAKLTKLEKQAELASKNATLAGDLSASEKHKQDQLKFGVMKWLDAHGHLTNDEIDTGLNSMETMRKGNGLEFTPDKVNALKEFLGMSGGIHLGARQPETGNPMQSDSTLAPQQGDLQAPVSSQTEAAPMDKKAMAKALYDRMKEGDVQTFDGVKYTRKGKELVRVH